MATLHRNRVIYQSEALFISPDATGYHYTGRGGYGLMTPPVNANQSAGGVNKDGQLVGWQCGEDWPEWNPNGEESLYAKAHGSIIKQLKRVQSANYGFTVSKTDINQFGHLSKLDSIVIESPTVNLDFSYYLIDGYNERQLEFITNGEINSTSGHLAPEVYQAGNNYFILTTPESRDAVVGDTLVTDDNKTVISIGNGYITDYTVDISVGQIPTASVQIEAMNIKTDIGATGIDVPSLNGNRGTLVSKAWEAGEKGVCTTEPSCTGLFSLPPAVSGFNGCGDVASLRPGDVVLDLASAELLSKQIAGTADTLGSAHIQSCNINIPFARTNLQRLGSTFGFTRAVDMPLTVTMNITAILSDLKKGNMVDLLCGCDTHEVSITIHDPECISCGKDSPVAMKYTLKGATLVSESFSSSIGDNKTVELTFTSQIGGPDDTQNGFFIYGKESLEGNNGIPPHWENLDGETNIPFTTEVPPDAEPYRLDKTYSEAEVIQLGNRYYRTYITMHHYN